MDHNFGNKSTHNNLSGKKIEKEKPTSSVGQLPILEYKTSIMELLDKAETGIIIGETGSGKTTEMPIFLLEKLKKGEKIAMTQPRRVAARSVSKFVASKVGCRVGEKVGFNIRFEDRTTEGTQLTFMTDGILLRKIQEDNLLSEYKVVVVDEAHERSLNIDFSLGLLKQIQAKRKEMGNPLQVIVTSATLEKEKFEKYFDQAPSVEVPGRLYPVDTHFEEYTPRDVMEAAAEKVKNIFSKSDSGDVLIFMPGKQEIEETIKNINDLKIPNLEAMPLFGDMSPEDQDKIFNKINKRKVVVATNIAETSITVPGLKYVVDSGLIRQTEYNHETGIESLVTKFHAKSGAKQRAGRAGRMEAGECYRLYSESDFKNKFQEYQTPEIQRSNLSHVVLTMKKIGIDNVENFDFIDPPEKKAFVSAIETLKNLGALDESGKLTNIGEIMSDLPLEPHLGRMVLEAKNHKCVQEIATITAFLNGRSVFMRPKDKESEADQSHQQFKDSDSDFMTFLNVWNAYAQNGFKEGWAYKNFLNAKVLTEVESVRSQLFRVLKQNNIQATSLFDKEAIGKSLTAGLIENLFEHDRKWWYKGVIKESNDGVAVFPGSSTRNNSFTWFVSEDIYTNPKGDTYARTIQKVKPEWITEVAPQLVDKESQGMSYNESTDSVVSDMRYYLKSTRTGLANKNEIAKGEKAENIFAEYLANNDKVLEFQKQNKEIINQLDILFKKSAGQIQSTNLKDEYQKILAGREIYGIKKLNEALKNGEIKLRLLLENYADSKLVKTTLENNPDKINIDDMEYPVEYKYSGYYESDKTNPESFSAKIYIPISDLLSIDKIPEIPSGKQINICAVTEPNSKYSKFSGTNIELLRTEAKEYLINELWDKWRYSVSTEERIEDYDFSSGVLPKLPKLIEFGKDPISKESLFAYPGFVKESYYDRVLIKYFKKQEEAESNTNQAQEYANEKLKEKKIIDEREKLIAPTREKISDVKNIWSNIQHSYSEYGLIYSERDRIDNAIYYAERYMNDDPHKALEYIDPVIEIVKKAERYKELKEKSRIMAEEAIEEYYGDLPEIDGELVDFPIDENGNESENVAISRIFTNNGKIIAEHAFDRINNESYVYVLNNNDENAWQGEPFDSIDFEDFGMILTPEQAQERIDRIENDRYEREQKERIDRYDADLEYAQNQVEKNYWQEGKFRKVFNQKGFEQWEIKRNGVLYIVDSNSEQPYSPNRNYFFSVVKTLANVGGTRVMSVVLERPYPEDAPGYDENTQKENEQNKDEKDILGKLNSLQNKFGKK